MLRHPNLMRQAFGPGWALVGDAGYHRDAVTAHGISDAFRDAELLAVAVDQALAACITSGLANIAAARRVRLTEVRSTVTGDIDLNGILGLNADVRNGYEKITVRFTIKGDAPAEKLREIVEQSRARSAVYDVITNGVPVAIEVDTP